MATLVMAHHLVATCFQGNVHFYEPRHMGSIHLTMSFGSEAEDVKLWAFVLMMTGARRH